MKKKILSILLIGILVIVLTGCGGKEEKEIVNSSTPKEKKTAVVYLIDKANKEDLDYQKANENQSREMWTFTHEKTEQTDALTDYRYIGSNPNNYVTFNNELWRIVGIFSVDDGTGKLEERLKIMRDEVEEDVVWNSEKENDWTKASLNTYLNGTYFNELSNESQNMIDNAVWYLGGIEEQYANNSAATSSVYYQKERGSLYYKNNAGNISLIAKVGLIYPSDYGFSTSGGSDRKLCLDTPLVLYNSYGYEDCKSNSWMYNYLKYYYEWTLNPITTYFNKIVAIDYYGAVTELESSYTGYGQYHPVVYLKSSVKITSGDGTKNDPYELGF